MFEAPDQSREFVDFYSAEVLPGEADGAAGDGEEVGRD